MAELGLTVYTDDLVQPGREAAGLLLLGLLGSFAFIRMSTRLMRSPRVTWWPGSVKPGGLHIHHLVFGIVILMVSGFLSFALEPEGAALMILALAFGVGAGLTLDEFALWLYLEDVYWSEQGRRSVDAVVLAVLLGGLFLVAVPLGFDEPGPAAVVISAAVVNLTCCSITFLKGKIVFGLIGLFVPIFAYIGAIRLGRPKSPWARWRYGGKDRKVAASREREIKWARRRRRWSDIVGGAPDRKGAEV